MNTSEYPREKRGRRGRQPSWPAAVGQSIFRWKAIVMKRCLVTLALLTCQNCLAATVIPIELEKGNPVAPARINGVAARLIIDSGGGFVSLKSETLGRVAAVRTGSTKSGTDALGNSAVHTLFTLDALEVGGDTFANVEAGEAGQYGTAAPGDGSIGRNFLNQFIVIYDYPSRKITLFTAHERRTAERECRGAQVRTMRDPDEIIVSMATTDHGAMRMLWDTGATYSFVKKAFADEQALPIEAPFYTSKRFVFARQDFGPLQLVVLDFKAPVNVDGYIGYNFFMGHVVCIDPLKRVVKIRKS